MYQDHFGLRFHGEWDDAGRKLFTGLSLRCFVSAVGKRQTLASSHVLTDLLCWIFASFRFTFLSVVNIKSELTRFTLTYYTFLVPYINNSSVHVTPKNNMYWVFNLLSRFQWNHLWMAVHIQQLLFITALLLRPVSILVTWTIDQVFYWWIKALIFFSCWIKYFIQK